MRGHAAALAMAVWLVACSSTPATFALIGASVDPTYKCPGGANNAAYDLHATIDARIGRTLWPKSQLYVGSLNITNVHSEAGRIGDTRPPLGRILYVGLKADFPWEDE